MRLHAVLLLCAAAAAKKKKAKKAKPISACEACERITEDLQKTVKQQIRLKFMGRTEDWSMNDRLVGLCESLGRAGDKIVKPHCDTFAAGETGNATSAYLDALVRTNNEASNNEPALRLPAMRRAICGVGGPLGVCHANHHFPEREHKEAVDVAFKNDAGAPLDVYFLRHGKDWDDETLFTRRYALGAGEFYREHAFQHHTFRFLLAGQEWDRGVDVTLGDAKANRGSEAWALEPRPGYVEENLPKFVPEPGVEKPEAWDDEEDGEWEAPVVRNALRNKTNTPLHKRRLSEDELAAPPFVASAREDL